MDLRLRWQNKRWKSLEHFNTSQKRWGIAGLLETIIILALILWSFVIQMDDKSQLSEAATQDQQTLQQTLDNTDDERRREQMIDLNNLMQEAQRLNAEYDARESADE